MFRQGFLPSTAAAREKKKKRRKGLCKNEIVCRSDGDSKRCCGRVSVESGLLFLLTHLRTLLSHAWSFRYIFFVDLLVFLPGEQKNWPKCPSTLDPDVDILGRRVAALCVP